MRYGAECRINGADPVDYSDTSLSEPAFSATLTVDPADLLECRVQNIKVITLVEPNIPVEGPWTDWAQPQVALAPPIPNGVTFIQIKQQ
jgi:hypothetical protein